MDNNQEDHLDKPAGINFQENMKLFKEKDMEKQATEPSRNDSDASVVKAPSPCKGKENTNRKLPSPEPPTGNDEQTSTSLRFSSLPDSPKGTEGKTATTNESRFKQTTFDEESRAQVKKTSSKTCCWLSSLSDSPKGTEGKTATTNESRMSSSLRSTAETDEETQATNISSFGISSSTEPTKRTEEETAATNESSFGISSSIESTKGTEEETAATNESRFNQKQFNEELHAKVKEISSRKGCGWSPKDLEVFKHPMCLIRAESEVNEDGEEVKINLKSEEKVFEQIKQIDLPIVVVAVVGLYRTGKSYLMNCLAESFKGGFELGNTIQSQTKGIWVWCKMHPTQKDTVLVLLDTEGLGDVEKGDQNHDNNLFTLATLLCNCLVFNIKGAFDNEAVSKLTFVTEMAKNIRYRGNSSEDNKMLNLILPDFVLCLRDFTLKLMVDGGKSISPNEYLERSLAAQTKKRAHYNKPRECIRKYFPKRSCFTFPMPGDTNVIQDLENLRLDELCESFRKTTAEFVSSMYDVPPKEMLGSKPINGEIFVTLADRYVTAIKHGAVPDVDDAFTAAAKIENAKIEKQALEIFENQMIKVVLPVPGNVLTGLYTIAQQATLEYLRKNVVHDLKAECEYHAQRKMDELWYKVKENNDKKVQEMCEKELDLALKGCLEEKLRRKEYETAGGYRKFQRDVERLREEYVSNLPEFEENEILYTWHGFVKCKKEIEARIVEADEQLSKKEKEDEQRRNQEYIEKILQEQQKAHREALDKHSKDLEDHYQKLNEARDEQLKADQAKHEALVKERLEKEAAQKEINRYKEETKQRKDKWFGARMWNALLNDD